MSFDLGFWHEDRPISAQEADAIYGQICDGNDRIVKPYPLTHFLEALSQRYSPIETYDMENIEECPWNCGWDVGQGSVVVCMAWSRANVLTPILIELAHEHDLLCYNPQRGEVYLPASLPRECT
jgi:hypothetical protein